MKLPLLALAIALLVFAPCLRAVQPVIPSRYLSGPISRDVAAAMKRGKDEHRPVWIIAWDQKYSYTPEGKKDNVTDYNLHYFYQFPEVKKLVANNFIQVFTTMDNPLIEQWLNAKDEAHVPIFIVLDNEGNLFDRHTHYANPDVGRRSVNEIWDRLVAAGGAAAAK